LFYSTATNAMTVLNKNTTATRYLSNTGTNNDPAWAQINLANGVTGDLPLANIVQGTALSVLGVTGNATADYADIVAASDGQVVRRSGTAVGFGALDLASANAITGDLPFANLTQGSALSVLGVTGNSTADNASIAAGSDHQVLRRSGTAVAFGAVNLAQSAAVTGILAKANGGTGVDNTTQTYSPSATSVANLDSTPTMGTANYTRTGDIVTVSGRITMDPTTTGTLTQARLSLPIASNFSDTDQAAGTFANRGVIVGGVITSVAATDDVIFEFICADTASRNYIYTFQYRVI
jgi:hypothetical protein